MHPLKTYDLRAVALIVGGIEISGYGEDGAIEFEHVSPIAEHAAGADGSVVVSRNNDGRMIARITLLETSKSYRDLAGLLTAQNAQPAILPHNFIMIDAVNGDRVSDQFAAFLSRPAPSKGKAVGSRVFELLLPNAGKTAIYGALNLI